MDQRPTVPSLDRHPPSPTSAEQIILKGPSDLPDPQFHAYRRDLADRAIAAKVISSHYADPVRLELVAPTQLKSQAEGDSETLAELAAGQGFRMLENKLGWAWGYADADGRVGYVPSEALGLD